MTPPSARAAAATTIHRVIDDGAYSNVLVARVRVDPPDDHGTYQRIVYDALRWLPGIDRAIAMAADRPMEAIDPRVAGVLRMALADMIGGTPAHAAVDEAVTTVRAIGRGRASGFVNAVLRSATATGPRTYDWPEDAFAPDLRALIEGDHAPAWTDAFLVASNEPPPVGVRYRDGSHRDAPIPGSVYVDGTDALGGDIERGTVDIIDPASAAVSVAADVAPGHTVIGLAAAPGGKVRAMADALGGDGTVVSMDLNARRASDAARRSRRMPIRWVVGDALAPPFAEGAFDRVVLDAPCTGLGTLRRRPEIRNRVDRSEVERHRDLQRAMLERARSLVRPGGRLVYSVCTITSAETLEVVSGLGFAAPPGIPGEPWGDGVLLAPHTTGTDGMFIAVADR